MQIEKVMYERGGFILEKAHGNAFIASTKAIIDHLKDWFSGSDRTVSMGIILDEERYGVPAGLCYSMPTVCKGLGVYEVVEDLTFNENQKKRISEGVDELLKEKILIQDYLLGGGK